MSESHQVPPAPPPPPLPSTSDALQELLADEDDEYREKRFQKNLQFRMVGAIEKENVQLMQELIEAGVNTNATILLVKLPLTHVVDNHTVSKDILRLLLSEDTETDPNLGEKTPWGLKPMHIIATNGDVEIARIFLESPRGSLADINVRDNGGATPLHFAIFHGNTDMVLYLISKGADVFAVDNCGRSTLHRACETHNYEIADILLERGVSVDVMDKYMWTPIFHSVFFKHMQMVKFLIERGADVERVDVYGESLIRIACYLQWAVERGKHYPVKITVGTSLNFYERSKGIPSESVKELLLNLDDRMYDLTDFFGHLYLLKLLINAGADPNTYRSDGYAQTGLFDALAKTRAYLVLAGAILDPSDPWVTRDTSWRPWFAKQVIEQYSLKIQCRRQIRRSLKQTRNINMAVSELPLPKSLQMFLQLNDFDVLLNKLALNEQ